MAQWIKDPTLSLQRCKVDAQDLPYATGGTIKKQNKTKQNKNEHTCSSGLCLILTFDSCLRAAVFIHSVVD